MVDRTERTLDFRYVKRARIRERERNEKKRMVGREKEAPARRAKSDFVTRLLRPLRLFARRDARQAVYTLSGNGQTH